MSLDSWLIVSQFVVFLQGCGRHAEEVSELDLASFASEIRTISQSRRGSGQLVTAILLAVVEN